MPTYNVGRMLFEIAVQNRASAGLASVEARAREHANRMQQIFRHTSQQLSGFGRGIVGGGLGLRGLYFGLGVASGYQVAQSLRAGVAAATDFEHKMAIVKAVTASSARDMQMLTDAARDFGRTSRFSAISAAEGMRFFGLAGYKPNEIMEAMGPTLDFAAANEISVGQAGDVAARGVAGMGLKARDTAHLLDVLTKAAVDSNTDVLQLGDAVKYIGPIGVQAGASVEELVASMMIMSDAGIRGSMAGTGLRNVFMHLTKPSKDAAKVMKELGLTASDAAGNFRPLADIVDDFNEKIGDMGDAEKLGVLFRIFEQRGGTAFAELMNKGGDALRGLTEQLRTAGGTTADIARSMEATLRGKLDMMKAKLTDLAITIGNVFLPNLKEAVDWVGQMATKLGKLSDEDQQAIRDWTVFGARFLLAYEQGRMLLNTLTQLSILAATGGPLGVAFGGLALLIGNVASAFEEAKLRGEEFAAVFRRYPGMAKLFNVEWIVEAEDRAEAEERRVVKTGELAKSTREIAAGGPTEEGGAIIEKNVSNQTRLYSATLNQIRALKEQLRLARERKASLDTEEQVFGYLWELGPAADVEDEIRAIKKEIKSLESSAELRRKLLKSVVEERDRMKWNLSFGEFPAEGVRVGALNKFLRENEKETTRIVGGHAAASMFRGITGAAAAIGRGGLAAAGQQFWQPGKAAPFQFVGVPIGGQPAHLGPMARNFMSIAGGGLAALRGAQEMLRKASTDAELAKFFNLDDLARKVIAEPWKPEYTGLMPWAKNILVQQEQYERGQKAKPEFFGVGDFWQQMQSRVGVESDVERQIRVAEKGFQEVKDAAKDAGVMVKGAVDALGRLFGFKP